MAESRFDHVKIAGITNVVPPRAIHIDDELHFFQDNAKKLARAKKMVGYGTRYVVDDGVTVIDLCEEAGHNLINEMAIDRSLIDGLIVVCQSPDYLMPSSSSILHGRLDLPKSCAAFDVALGCSGYVYGLWLAHSLIASGALKKVLLLAGDAPSVHADLRNRKSHQLFGDAASATLIEYCEEKNTAYFSLGSDGKGWDKIIVPAGGRKLPVRQDMVDLEIIDDDGNVWYLWDHIIKGMDVFNFTMDVAPKNIRDILSYSGKTMGDIDFVAIHQANKQIVDAVANKGGVPPEKTSAETFHKYGNNSTNSVATVIGDVLSKQNPQNIMLVAFGVGLSWGSCIINIANIYNGAIRFFNRKGDHLSRQEQIDHWIKHFKGN